MAGKGKTAHKGTKQVQKVLYGEKVQLINLSSADNFCAYSGSVLPKNGMVVKYEGEYYLGWNESKLSATSSK
jgi:hypothetical protein